MISKNVRVKAGCHKICIALTAMLLSGTAQAQQSSSCDPQVWEAMKAKSMLEAQREITQNQNLITKPDSVLQLSCFDSFLESMASGAADNFSETTEFGLSGIGSGLSGLGSSLLSGATGAVSGLANSAVNSATGAASGALSGATSSLGGIGSGLAGQASGAVTGLANDALSGLTGSLTGAAQTALDSAFQAVPFASMQSYLTSNFDHNYLGGRAGVGFEDTSYDQDQPYGCSEMSKVWQSAQQMNFIDDPATDGFFDFAYYQNNVIRNKPASGAGPVGDQEAMANIYGPALNEAYNGNPERYTVQGETASPFDGEPYKKDKIPAELCGQTIPLVPLTPTGKQEYVTMPPC